MLSGWLLLAVSGFGTPTFLDSPGAGKSEQDARCSPDGERPTGTVAARGHWDGEDPSRPPQAPSTLPAARSYSGLRDTARYARQ